MGLQGREAPMRLYCARGEGRTIDQAAHLGVERIPFDVVVRELEPGEAVERDGYDVVAFRTRHGRNSLGYALVEHERLGRFDPDGVVRYRPPAQGFDMSATYPQRHTNGMTATTVTALLQAAAFSGDPELLAEGLRSGGPGATQGPQRPAAERAGDRISGDQHPGVQRVRRQRRR
jgi:ribonuclease BN (tRNA processing enzyme)